MKIKIKTVKIPFILAAIICLSFLAKPIFAQEGLIYLSPASAGFQSGSELSVKLILDTRDIVANAVQVKLFFDKEILEATDIIKKDSVLSLWPQEPAFSNQTGEISLIGGLPQPGFQGTGEIAEIKFRAKKEGQAVFSFDDSKILANDGLGTNILKYTKGAKYLVYSETESEKTALEIISLSHPSQDEWYGNNSPAFSWNTAGKEASFILDQNQNTIPDEISEGSVSSKDYDQIADGIWYFHLRIKNETGWGETSHYQVKIDTKPPRNFEIIIDNQGDLTNPSPKIYFETQDDISGIFKYRVKIGDNDFIDLMAAQITDFAPKLEPGNYKITVKAIDMAYNSVGAGATLDIKSIEVPNITLSPKIYMAGQENMYIQGTSVAGSSVTVLLEKEGNEIKTWQTAADKDGQWFLRIDDLIKPGIYTISAIAQDVRGAMSAKSDPVDLEIKFNGLNIAGSMIAYEKLIFILFCVVLLAVILAVYIIMKTVKNKKSLQKETKEASDSLLKNFAALDAEIRKKIEFLDQKPGFNEEEKKMYQEIKKSLETAAASINKEIKDIEKEIK